MASNGFLIDSCVLVSFFRDNDTNHDKALKWIRSLNGFFINDYVLLEVSTVLQVREAKQIAAKALKYLVFNKKIQVLRVTEEELAQTVALFIRQNDKISFVDANLLILAKERGLQLATFDKDIVKAGALLTGK